LDVLDLRTDEMALNISRLCRGLGIRTQLEATIERTEKERLANQESVPATKADVRAVADRLDQAVTAIHASLDNLRDANGGHDEAGERNA
jgi:hypothetical protein